MLKCCPSCQRLYDPDAGFCPIDGAQLDVASNVPLPADGEDRRIGTTVCNGRFEVRRKVADGGMGRVYQARDLQHEANVAVKVLHPEVAGDQVQLERFRREYKLSAELPHDHIVEVRDFQETEDGSYALAMEYLEGEELRMLLKREKTVPPHRLVRILSQLAIGLREPHQRKFVHRDIKPDNIFLCHTEEGPIVKLLDFGSVRDNTAGAKKLTVVGTTIGSPFYMSPEQAQGLPELDHRADVWSLTAIVYEALTGSVPFAGKTGPQILLGILSQDPQVASEMETEQPVPPPLDDVFDQGLAKEYSHRHADVAGLADAFGRAYGLDGDHLQWAYQPETQLEAAIAERLPAMMQQPSKRSQADEALAIEPPAASSGGEPDPFADDDFVMGVPEQTSAGLVVGIGVGAVVLLVGALAFFLL